MNNIEQLLNYPGDVMIPPKVIVILCENDGNVLVTQNNERVELHEHEEEYCTVVLASSEEELVSDKHYYRVSLEELDSRLQRAILKKMLLPL